MLIKQKDKAHNKNAKRWQREQPRCRIAQGSCEININPLISAYNFPNDLRDLLLWIEGQTEDLSAD